MTETNKTGVQAGQEPLVVCASEDEREKLMLKRSERNMLVLQLAQLEHDARMADASPAQCGVFVFGEAVTSDTVKTALSRIRHYALLKPGAEITIIMNSPGGSVSDGLALYDELEALKSKGHTVTVYVRGWAASMGGVLLQAASDGRRFIGANGYVLIHQISYALQGNQELHEKKVAAFKRVQNSLLVILNRRSILTNSEFQRLWKKPKSDCWLNSEQAVQLGFADAIA